MSPVRRAAAGAVAALAAVLLTVPAAASASSAALSTTAPSTGADVSYPQCADGGTSAAAGALPADAAFAIVGVNDGLATGRNPCTAAELAWAAGLPGGTGAPPLAVYVNTANPSLAAAWWPRSNALQHGGTVHDPYGTCHHRAGAACGYVYGYSIARDDAVRSGVIHPASVRWWLDVETANTWSGDRAANRAVLEGMVAAFRSVGATTGIYATRTHWSTIAGTVPAHSSLAAQASWLAGATTRGGAAADCSHAPLTARGRILLTQWTPGNGFDHDLACLRLATSRPRITGTARVGTLLTASAGTWTHGTRFAYRWYRGRTPIAGATGRTHRATRADLRRVITVRVTGTLAGYDRAVVPSGPRTVR